MASENETIADIVKEKRDSADEAEKKGKNTFAFDLAKMLREEANRIEASHNREIAVQDAEIAELRECLEDACRCMCLDCDVEAADGYTKCGHECRVRRWRKALEGTTDESK